MGLLLALAGYGLGAGLTALAVIAGAVAVMLLPGLVSRAPAQVEVQSGVADSPPPGTDDQVALDVLEDAALVVGGDRIVLAANRAAKDLLGEVAGEDVRLVIRHPVALETVDLSLTTGQEAVRELDGFGRAGHVYRLRAAPVAGDRLLLNFVDITPARAAERMRADFVANASHELRTPLATVSGFIETLQGPAADDEAARSRFLALMAEEAARMTRLIDDLLSLSRIEIDKSLRPRSRIDLEALVREFADTFKLVAESAGRELIIDAGEGLPQVLADRDQTLQVLNNLVSNAIKYGRPGTPVTLSLRSSGGSAAVTVRDEGEGVEPEHIPRLTERFYRVDPGRSRRLGGTGLGLAIVKHIVERHRGTLEIRSEIGRGTAVCFRLPAAPAGVLDSAAEGGTSAWS